MAIKLPKKGAPEPTALEVLKAYQQEQLQERQRTLEAAKRALNPNLAEIFEAIQQAQLKENKRVIDDLLSQMAQAEKAKDMVSLFTDVHSDDGELQEWIDANRDSLTVEDLKAIIMAAMVHGLSEAMRQKQAPRKEQAQDKNDKINALWKELKAQGLDKTAAAKIIATQVHQALTTVRRKLQKM